MNRKIVPLLLALVMATSAMALVPLAEASHMQDYMNLPTERDDQGRSDEPDHAFTSVFGLEGGNPISNCVVASPTSSVPDTRCMPDPNTNGKVIAPGCTDANGARQLSGLCGLWTVGVGPVPPGTAGVQGAGCQKAPGAFSAGCNSVTFFSNVITEHLAAPSQRMIDYNHKIDDARKLAGLGAGQDFLAGPIGEWFWYGDWIDRNGNGVIDTSVTYPCNGVQESCVNPDNEWIWHGSCTDFFGVYNPNSISRGYCKSDPAYGYDLVYPGNHHGNCGGGLILGGDLLLVGCFYTPNDLPGVQVYCTAKLLAEADVPPVVVLVENQALTPHFCPGSVQDMDGWSQSEFGSADLLFDQNGWTPGVSTFDFTLNDRSGDPDPTTRQWSQNTGWAQYYYDTSIVDTTDKVAVMFDQPENNGPFVTLDPAHMKYQDVDRYVTYNPALQSLFENTVRPTTSTNWRAVRDLSVPANNLAQTVTHSKTTDTNSIVGPAEVQYTDPGFAHEPNTAQDNFGVAAIHGDCGAGKGDATFNGWCNTYNYQAAPHAWLDLQMQRMLTDNIAWTWNPTEEALLVTLIQDSLNNEVGPCVQCTAGPGATTSISLGPRAAGDHSRSLDPGLWDFFVEVGSWQDKPQVSTESVLSPTVGDPLNVQTTTYNYAADGWIGNIVDTTGDYHYRGYSTDTCTINGVSAARPYAFCHPYSDGTIQDPNAYTSGLLRGEWNGDCQVPFTFTHLTLKTADGKPFSFPMVVYRDFEQMALGDTTEIELYGPLSGDNAGKSSVDINLACFDPTVGFAAGADEIILPEGNLGQGVVTSLTANVHVGTGTELITDVDNYVPFGGNL